MTKNLNTGATLKRLLIIATCVQAVFFAGYSLAERPAKPPSTEVRSEQADTTLDGYVSSALLQITGAISPANPHGRADVDMTLLKTLPLHSLRTSTVVTDGILKFDGVLMRDLLNHIGARGKTVTATALNGYEVDIPIKDFEDFDVLLAWSANGERLKADDKGPFWIIYPRDQHAKLQDIRYDYRWVWQLNALRVN